MRSFFQLFLSLFLLTTAAKAEDSRANLTVLTDAALMLPLSQIARNYTGAQDAAVAVVMTDGQNATQQIGQGLDANVLVTANQSLLKELNERGLIDVFGKRTVAQAKSPEGTVAYQGVLIASEALESSRAFLTYLQSEHAQEIFARYGLHAPN